MQKMYFGRIDPQYEDLCADAFQVGSNFYEFEISINTDTMDLSIRDVCGRHVPIPFTALPGMFDALRESFPLLQAVLVGEAAKETLDNGSIKSFK